MAEAATVEEWQPGNAKAEFRRLRKIEGEIEAAIVEGRRATIEIVRKVAEVKDNDLHALEYSADTNGLFAWAKARFGFSTARTYRLLKASDVLVFIQGVSPFGETLPTSEGQLRPLTRLLPSPTDAPLGGRPNNATDKTAAAIPDVWLTACEKEPDPPARIVNAIVRERFPELFPPPPAFDDEVEKIRTAVNSRRDGWDAPRCKMVAQLLRSLADSLGSEQ